VATPPAKRDVPRAPRIGAAPVALVAALVAAGLWGAWVTKNVLGHDMPPIAKVQLSGIVGEYVQAQARSATPPEQVTAETRAFMGEIQRNLERAGAGQIVLVGEAVLAGNVPDITAERAARSLHPGQDAAAGCCRPAANDVMGAMRAAMAGLGTPQAAHRRLRAMLPTEARQLRPNAWPPKHGARHRCGDGLRSAASRRRSRRVRRWRVGATSTRS
jgi:hypothetical protein